VALGAGYLLSIALATRASLLMAGFLLLLGALLAGKSRLWTPSWLVTLFALYGGASAVIAVWDKTYATRWPDGAPGFRYAYLVTVLGGLCALAGAFAFGWFGGVRERPAAEPESARLERAGKIFVVLALMATGAAVARLLASSPGNNLWASMKSLWEGSSYLLLLAGFGAPGFGLWLAGMLRRPRSSRDVVTFCVASVVFVGGLAATGQRIFAVTYLLAVVAALIGAGRLPIRRVALVLAVGVVLLGPTQALRNVIRETNTVSLGDFAGQFKPQNLRLLYGSQLESFRWTWDVASQRSKLQGIPNTFLEAPTKPIPRQLLPGKFQGFGQAFTADLYPAAAAAHVGFATPLVAESDFNFGPAGVAVVFLLLGLALAFGEVYIANASPRALGALWSAAIVWCAFVFVRGDFANALVVAAMWIVPLTAVSLVVGFRTQRRGRRIVIDALQVPKTFSGLGRQALAIGSDMHDLPSARTLELRCAVETAPLLKEAFPPGTLFRTPIRRSRPRLLRIGYQQLWAPLLDPASTTLVCLGDQAPLIGRAKVVLTIHDVRRLTEPATSGRLEAFYYRFVVPRAARHATAVITISEFSRQEIARALGPSVRTKVVAHHPQPKVAEAAPSSDGSHVLVVGALRRYKGVTVVLDALAQLTPGERPRVTFVGAAEDPAVDFQRYAESLGVADAVDAVGWVEEDELDRLYRTAVATVSPSTYEGYGLSVGESLAYGLPTIASGIPPHREVAGDAALYFESGHASELADCLRRTVGSQELRVSLGRRALERSRALASSPAPSWRELILATATSDGVAAGGHPGRDEHAAAESVRPRQ
jgi:glycosyltransferase involved in cell wall biosynthesis